MPGPPLGTIELRTQSLEKAIHELGAALSVFGVELTWVPKEAIARRTIRAYLSREREERKLDIRISPFSIELAEMEIDEVRLFPAAANQTYRNRMKTARKLMLNPRATWRQHIQPDGQMRIERMSDGMRPEKDPLNNKGAVFLASLTGAEGFVPVDPLVIPYRQAIGTNMKVSARRILGVPEAQWKARTTRHGLLVRRTK